MSARQGLLLLFILALAAAAGYWFHTHFVKVKKENEIGFQGEARMNYLLAAQRYFESLHIVASSHEGIRTLPASDATLILPGARYEMGRGEAQSLLAWVKAGGHLVVVPSNAYNLDSERADPLLDELGLRAIEVETPQSQGIIDVDWPDEHDFITITSDADTRLDYTGKIAPSLMLEDHDGIYLLRLQVGQGWLTVLPDSNFMSNYRLKLYDHAAYLWRVAQVGKPRPVWLIYQDSMPPLHEWLSRYAWQVLIASALFLLTWLWAASRRLGPMLAPSPLVRRRLLDHVEASGRFLWRSGQGERLLRGVRGALHRSLELRHPAWASLPSQALYERLAQLTRLSPAQVQSALLYTHLGSEHEFTQVIQILERIRKAL